MQPGPSQQQRRQRFIGAALVVLLGLVVVAVMWRQGFRRQDRDLQAAFGALAAAERCEADCRHERLVQAQRQFTRAVAVISMEPQAMIGVAVIDALLVLPAPLPSSATATVCGQGQGCTESEAIERLTTLLKGGRPDLALRLGGDPGVSRHRGQTGTLLRFAQLWQDAREHPAAGH